MGTGWWYLTPHAQVIIVKGFNGRSLLTLLPSICVRSFYTTQFGNHRSCAIPISRKTGTGIALSSADSFRSMIEGD